MIKKNFILQEVIDDLINPEKSLVGPLMKLNYFGRLTKNEELIDFTTKEINGYKFDYTNIPAYRKAIGTLIVDAQVYEERHNLELPVSMLVEPLNENLRYVDIREGISVIEKMEKKMNEDDKASAYRPIPMEILRFIEPSLRKLYKSEGRIDAVGAKLKFNENIILEIQNYIRTKLLEFVMQIADNFGYDIEIESFNKEQINNKTINNIMNTVINTSGDGNVVNTGNQNKIHSNVTIEKGDLEKLTTELKKQGVDDNDIIEIADIVQTESSSSDENKLGEKANNWILKVIEKSLKGIGSIATGVSSNILSTLIKGYYGIE